jgi:hypothetical protein
MLTLSDEKREDIKLTFDSLRNIAICTGLLVGMPHVGSLIFKIFGSSTIEFLLMCVFAGIILGLYIFNILWLISGLSEKPSSKWLHSLSLLVVIGTSSLALGGAVFLEVWPKIAVYVY